jgi:hypothetical protein
VFTHISSNNIGPMHRAMKLHGIVEIQMFFELCHGMELAGELNATAA